MKFCTGITLLVTFFASLAPAQRAMAPGEFISWLPVTAEERDIKTPSVEKDAGAEILMWRVHVLDEVLGSDLHRVFYHYVRLKIFDEKGKEKAATIDLSYNEPGAILDVAGRTIRPDGTILELEKKAIYKRDLVRAGSLKQKSVSFAMPGVEPGVIIEYRWRQTEDDNRFRYTRLHFERDFPVRKVTYFVRPLDPKYLDVSEQMFLLPINCAPSPIQRSEDGYVSTSVENIPAARVEPMSLSRPNIEPWALLYYRTSGAKDGKKFWSDTGKTLYKEQKEAIKVNDDLKTAVAAATAGANTQDEKVAAMAAWLHKNVRNLFGSDVTDAERTSYFAKLPKERARTSIEIFKSGLATSKELHVAFAALAQQAGVETRPVLMADRDEVQYQGEATPDRYFLDNSGIAIKDGEKWRVIDLSRRFLPAGMLGTDEEGVSALIGDPKAPEFIQTQVASPEASTELRVAHLELSLDGALEGDVVETSSGHQAEDLRREAENRSPAQQQERVHDEMVRRFPDAEVTAIAIENMADLKKPVIVRYHVKAPQFAQVTGKRLLFHAMPFRRSQLSPFSATTRRYPIAFPNAWKEVDEMHIRIPEGFALDNAANPGSVDFGKQGSYMIKMEVATPKDPPGPTELSVTRDLTFGSSGHLEFAVANYQALKTIFNDIQVRDGHMMSLIAK